MFNEAVDVPKIDMVIFIRYTQSLAVFLQQLGLGLKKYKEDLNNSFFDESSSAFGSRYENG